MSGSVKVPTPNFPHKLDSIRELFRVYDSSQAVLASDMEADADTILLEVRDASRGVDVWGENGFATINGEIIYYDSVVYEDVSCVEEIQPFSFNGPDQSYRLSQAFRYKSDREILRDIVVSGESKIANQEVNLSNRIDPSDFGYNDSTISSLPIDQPYSSFGRVKVNGVWSYFATKGSGGVINSLSGVYPANGITSIILTKEGITFYGVAPDLVEINYYYNPITDEPIVSSSLTVIWNSEKVIINGEITSESLASMNLDEATGLLNLSWNSNQRHSISVDFKRACIVQLGGCLRGYGSTPVPHSAGELVCGYVMADHHNNLAKAILGIEELVGKDQSEDIESIDYKLRMLEELDPERNPECPNGEMEIVVLEEETASSGPLVQFTLTSENSSSNRLFFGDGTFAENVTVVEHQYARGAQFAPSVSFFNSTCQEFSTAPGEEEEFGLPAINIPVIPTLEFPPIDLSLAPIEFPSGADLGLVAFTLPDLSVDGIPSEINLTPDLPTVIDFSDISLPTQIDVIYHGPSTIYFDPDFEMPSMITVTGMPSEIIFKGLRVPTQIEFTGNSIPSQISISLSIAVDTSGISGNCFKLVPCTI